MQLEDWNCSPALFPSNVVAEIAGMQPDMLRLWRSRGHLPKLKKRGVAYSAFEIAEIMVRYELSNNGIAPAKSDKLGRECAPIIVHMGVLNHPRCCEVIGPANVVEQLQQFHQESSEFVTHLTHCHSPKLFLVRRDSEYPDLFSTLDALDERLFKSAMVLNLHKCAEIIIARSKQPLFTCEYVGE
ncbi:MAG: hypothetical protein KJ755_01840, partial [Alphaproteobacteria bacterium]|nr:hypothetical protein [Alphaproteobacteria bacterium]